MAHEKSSGLCFLDPERLERARLRAGLSKTTIADESDLSRNTVLKAFRGEGIFAASAKLIAERLGFDDPNELRLEPTSTQLEATGEWEVATYLGPWVTCSNSLQFRLCQMKHLFIAGHLGRGKCYDLLNPSLRESNRIDDLLLRHPTVCARVGQHPLLAENLATYPDANGSTWWVVDRWLDAVTLEERLVNHQWSVEDTPRLAWEIALALRALHTAGIIFRELAPSRVLLTKIDNQACLTDFELAKLMENVPTVSSHWPDDPYRAPEVENGKASQASDLFSWARIIVQASSATSPDDSTSITDPDSVAGILPKPVVALLKKCLAPGPSKRPKSIDQVISVLAKAWPALSTNFR